MRLASDQWHQQRAEAAARSLQTAEGEVNDLLLAKQQAETGLAGIERRLEYALRRLNELRSKQ